MLEENLENEKKINNDPLLMLENKFFDNLIKIIIKNNKNIILNLIFIV